MMFSLILDVQPGYGRSGKFFAHQHHIKADIICLAKGMGNGFLLAESSPKFTASYGLLGTTFVETIWFVPE
jgi:acetylornithine aminotransferase